MDSDWPYWQTVTATLGNLVSAGVAIAIVILAYRGLRQWQREMKGKAKLELARKIVLTGLKFEDAFSYARFWVTSPSESAERPREGPEDPDETRILDERYARLNRLDAARQVLLELEQASWEGEVILDDDLDGFIKPYKQAHGKLYSAILTLFDERLPPDDTENLKLRQTVYFMGEDELSRSIQDATAALKQRLRKYLK